MPLHRTRYAVLLAPDDQTHEVETTYGDQLRAELEGPKNGLPSISAAPQHAVALWIWASLTRTGVIAEPFQTFKDRLLVVEPIKDADEYGDPATVDPT
jgi:hypothetical protein